MAVKRQKEEMAFWKKIDEREDEVLKYILQNREKRQVEKLKKEQEAQTKNPASVPVTNMTKPVTENKTAPVQNHNPQMEQKPVNQNPQMQQKPVLQNYHQGQSTGQVGGQNPVAYRQP